MSLMTYGSIRLSTKEEKRRKAEELAKAKKAEKKFYQTKSCYFGIVINGQGY